MIETMNEQQIEFANKMQEYDLSLETDYRFSSPRLDVNFCDDDASFPPLESGPEEVLDHPLSTLPFVAPSLFSASVDEDDLCCELGDVFTQVSDCHKTSLGTSCVDVMIVGPTSPDVIAHISPDHVDILHVSPLPSLPSLPSRFLECYSLSAHD